MYIITLNEATNTRQRLLNVFNDGFLAVLPFKNRPPILVELKGSNHDVAWVNANGDGRTVRFVPLDTVDVDNPLFTVDLGDLPLTTLVFSADNPNFVILSHRY